jgi:hypothetical protein
MMKKIMVISLVSVSLMLALLYARVGQAATRIGPKVRFAPLHIYLDSGNKPLAAFQFELKATAGQIKIVGVEGGQHKAFKEAPYYDPAALANDRIIIAAFNTGRELPKGRTRIATIHLQIIGDAEPDYELKLTVAADANAKEIPAEISFETRLGEGLRRSGKGE